MSMSEYHRAQKLRRPPPGRASQAARNVQTVANQLGYHLLAPFTDAVVDSATEYVDLRGRRLAQRSARGDGEAARWDKLIDSRTGFIYETARKYAVDMPESDEGQAGMYVIRRFFGQGLRAVISAPFEEQLVITEHMVSRMRGDDAGRIAPLMVEHHLDALEELLPHYRAALDLEDKVTAGEVGAAYEDLQMRYLDLVWAVFTYAGEPGHRSAMLAPVFDQDERLASIYAARRRGQSIGDGVDLDAEVDDLLADELAADEAERAAEAAGEGEGEASGAEAADQVAPAPRPLNPPPASGRAADDPLDGDG